MAAIERRVSHDARVAETYAIEFTRKDQAHPGFPVAVAALRGAWSEIAAALGAPASPDGEIVDADAVEIDDPPRGLPR